uniref:Uncharacterized protein n=1 Tax=Anguilla anguilla TaxID=7936 RepID=A0A0E9X9J6_ANGAN
MSANSTDSRIKLGFVITNKRNAIACQMWFGMSGALSILKYCSEDNTEKGGGIIQLSWAKHPSSHPLHKKLGEILQLHSKYTYFFEYL